MVEHISVTILTKNSERYLARCLEALTPFDEVLILDNGSTDKTLSIAERFGNVTIVEHPFTGFGPMKNLAASKARNGWILSIDSDEIATEAMVEAIGRLDASRTEAVYSFSRLNHYRGRPVRCCGWYPDRVVRLYHRDHTRFSDAMVHESLQLSPRSERIELDAPLLHYPFNSIEELIDKMQRYSTLYAEQSPSASSPSKAFWRASFAFFRNYFLQRGFLCGYEGLLISVSNAAGVFYKYMKLYEKRREAS